MIAQKAYESGLSQNVNRVTHYESGGDGSGDGGCDCIGLIIGAVRLAGGAWPWTHGSNYSARFRTQNLRKISSASELKKDDLVYKAREPGDDKYDLPARYRAGGSDYTGDLRDYYHVGVVTSVNPFQITHCTGVPGGIKKDEKIGNWQYFGWLDQVTMDGGENMDGNQYKVIGGTLMLRKAPSKSSAVLKAIPNGSIVTAHGDEQLGWLYVDYQGTYGYCMAKYLEPCGDNDYDDDTLAAAIDTAFANVYATLDELQALVKRAL